MKSKTEIDFRFDYRDDEHTVRMHNETFALVLFFSIPVIGQVSLVIALLWEYFYKVCRMARMLVKGIWWKVVKRFR